MRDLGGTVVILTRAVADNAALRIRLERAGATVLELPSLAVRPLADDAELRRELGALTARDRLVLLSRAGAEAVARTIASELLACPVAVIGAVTHAAARRAGLAPDFVPSRPDSATLARELPLPGGRILLCRSDRGRPDLATALRARGADVCEVVAYHTDQPTAADAAEARDALAGGRPMVCFASPSAVDGFVALVGAELASRARPIAIGPATAAHVRRRLGAEPRVARSTDDAAIAATIADAGREVVDAGRR